MITKFDEIVNVSAIGSIVNPINQTELFSRAVAENMQPAMSDKQKVLLLAVDIQRDFIEGGSLAVQGAAADVERLTHYIYDNMEQLTAIAATYDSHSPMQIFHACWWQDKQGKEPAPFTVITKQDLDAGHWTPRIMPEKTAEDLAALERQGKKQLCIWPYHCLEASTGGALENQFANMANFFSIARCGEFQKFGKGRIKHTEFYGAFYPEYQEEGTYNNALWDFVRNFDKIIVAGEAMDYCVYETTVQLCGEILRTEKNIEVSLLCDCTSSIGPREEAEKMFSSLADKYSVKLISYKRKQEITL